jgi:hypothetical protein
MLERETLRPGPLWLVAAGALAAGALLFTFDPATAGFFPPCPFRWATGLLCPGCGTLRAIHQILHGHFAAALALNPMLVLTLPLLAASLFAAAIPRLADRWPLRTVAHPAVPFIWLAAAAAFGIARNAL